MRKSNCRYIIIVATFIIAVLACSQGSVPAPQPAEPAEEPSGNVSPTKTSTVAARDTGKTPETITNNPTTTNDTSPFPPSETPLSPIPNFDDLLSFAPGGGLEVCISDSQPGVAMSVEYANLGGVALLCFQESVNPPTSA